MTASVQAAAAPSSPASKASPPKGWWGRIRWRVFDLLGAAFWLYALTKVFVADVDVAVVRAFAPALEPALAFRLVAYLAIAVLVVIFWRKTLLAAVYILAFPLVVLLLKVPYFLIRHRSWAMFLGLLQTASSIFGDFRWNASTKGLALVAAIFIMATDVPALIVPSAVYLAALLVTSGLRRAKRIFDAPSFVEVQRRAIRRLLSSKAVRTFWQVDEQYKREGVTEYDANQAQQIGINIATGIAINKVLYLWAYQLGRYKRRYSPGLVFNILSYSWVFLATLIGLTLLNVALLKVAPEQYATTGPRPFIAVLLYTLSTFALGSAGGIQPVGDLAYLLQFTAGLAAVLILAVLLLNVALTYLRERDDQATDDLINELREEARRQEVDFVQEYAVPVDEAYRRLEELGMAAVKALDGIVRAVPYPPSPPSTD